VLAVGALHQMRDLLVREPHRNNLGCLSAPSRPTTLAQLLHVVAGLGLLNPGINLLLADLAALHLPHTPYRIT